MAVGFAEIKPAKPHPAWAASRSSPCIGRNVVGVEAMLIVYLALLVVAQDFVSFLDFFEVILG